MATIVKSDKINTLIQCVDKCFINASPNQIKFFQTDTGKPDARATFETFMSVEQFNAIVAAVNGALTVKEEEAPAQKKKKATRRNTKKSAE
jgi:hypothetical protein